MTRAEFRRVELSRLVSLYGEYSVSRESARQAHDDRNVEIYDSALVSLIDKILGLADFVVA